MLARFLIFLLLSSLLVIAGCGGSGSARYGYRYSHDPFYYRGGYVRDRVHVVSEGELRELERLDSAYMPEPADSLDSDMGFGDMDMGGMDFDGF